MLFNLRKHMKEGDYMKELEILKDILSECELYKSAVNTMEFDELTICPRDALEESAAISVFLKGKEYMLRKSEKYIRNLLALHEKRDSLSGPDRAFEASIYRNYQKERFISVKKKEEYSRLEKKAYISWCEAVEKADFSCFEDALSELIEAKKENCLLRLSEQGKKDKNSVYDVLLDDFERGINTQKLDSLFEQPAQRIMELTERIRNSRKRIRNDFLSRPVPAERQMEAAKYVASLVGFDDKRGIITLAEQAFSQRLSENDVRMTTYIEPNNFMSNIFSVLHEAGHSLFEQLQPKTDFTFFIQDEKTEGMHESVSRFYENILGRSEGFIHCIYPKLKELFSEALSDVTERELYEAVNYVSPGLIRIESDEVTYTLHILIRYELEKKFFSGELSVKELPKAWNEAYEKYLRITPENDAEGVLQDVHWTSDFGYFPTYFLGNIYGAMYYERMKEDMDVDGRLREGSFSDITGWMKERVFKKADILSPGEWIRDITGREMCSEPFLSYLENKYTKLYEL